VTRRDPVNRAQRRLDRPPRERFATRELAFDADGDTCRGTLYLPGGDDEDSPVVVMAPGLGAERSFGYPAVAERFADAGYAAFLFDYREFGASDGDSQVVDPAGQRGLRGRDRPRPTSRRDRSRAGPLGRVAVGCTRPHARGGAARRRRRDRRGPDARRASDRPAPRREVPRALRVAGVRDLLGHRVGRGRTVPIVGTTEELAAITEPGTKRKYLDLVDRESTWRNETPARSLLRVASYRPVEQLDEIRAPTLLLAGTHDAIVDSEAVVDAGETLSRGTVVTMPADHFSPFGEDFRAGSWSSAFLLAGRARLRAGGDKRRGRRAALRF